MRFIITIMIWLLFQDNVDWRTDFLIQHYGEGEMKVPGCPQLSSGVFVSEIYFNLLFFFEKKISVVSH